MSAGGEFSPWVDFRDPGVRLVIDRYLDTMVRVLTRTGFDEPYTPYWMLRDAPNYGRFDRDRRLYESLGVELVRRRPVDPDERRGGLDWPTDAETMIGELRLRNVVECVSRVIEDGIPGDCLEAGVWRGGASIMMRAVLAAYGDSERSVWLADSFRGLPRPDAAYPQDRHDRLFQLGDVLAVSRETVERNFARYNLLDHQVRFLEGWFKDTLPEAPVERLAVLRLDGDMYQSTMDTLVPLYPKVSPGGFVIVDDYLLIEACRQAVDDYRRLHHIEDPILEIDTVGVYWRVTGNAFERRE